MSEKYKIPEELSTLLHNIDNEAEELQKQIKKFQVILDRLEGEEVKPQMSNQDLQTIIQKATPRIYDMMTTLKEWNNSLEEVK
jgi:hypothetical protein